MRQIIITAKNEAQEFDSIYKAMLKFPGKASVRKQDDHLIVTTFPETEARVTAKLRNRGYKVCYTETATLRIQTFTSRRDAIDAMRKGQADVVCINFLDRFTDIVVRPDLKTFLKNSQLLVSRENIAGFPCYHTVKNDVEIEHILSGEFSFELRY